MTSKLKRIITPVLILLGLMAPWALPTSVVSADIEKSLCGAAQDLSVNSTKDCSDTGGSESRFQEILVAVINIFSIIVGVVAVIMIMFSGFKYVTSGGNQESVKTAKQTLIYALVGLIIVALAQVIVRYVINKTLITSQSQNTSQPQTQPRRVNPGTLNP